MVANQVRNFESSLMSNSVSQGPKRSSGRAAGRSPAAKRRIVSLVRGRYQYLMDVGAWALALLAAVLFRYDFHVDRVNWWSFFGVVAAAAVLQLIGGAWRGLYAGRFVMGSFHEAREVTGVVVGSGLVLGIGVLLANNVIVLPRSSIFMAVPLALVLMTALRYGQRFYLEGNSRPGESAERTLIFGAGHLARNLVHRMRTDVFSPYVPVGLVDDDVFKSNFEIDGVRVLGTREGLPEIVAKTLATSLIISIGRADAALIREVTDAAEAVGLKVLVMPLLQNILQGKSRLSDLRQVAIEDIIGRNPIDTQVEQVADYLTGKRVLVTGAGGSIGSELSRQIMQYKPSEIILLDHDETGLQTAEFLILGHGLMQSNETVLADIRDADVMNEIFEQRRPDVVFHAAALKHLPVLERYSEEGWKTNVLGTLNVLNAAMAVGVKVFVNVSTDKAADPTSVLGYSKRLAEQLTAWAAEQGAGSYVSVRFGNVLGSRGSLLPIVQSMIEAGGPVTVTHADATRYFMTIPEASHLVIQAGGIGSPGEVLILDMGDPVRILDIVERMIRSSGRDVGITFTGLREGEKLDEVLMGQGESDERPKHPKISHASVPPLNPKDLAAARWVQPHR